MDNMRQVQAMAQVAHLLDEVDMVRLFTARDRLQSQFSIKTRTAASPSSYVKPQLAFREYVGSNFTLFLLVVNESYVYVYIYIYIYIRGIADAGRCLCIEDINPQCAHVLTCLIHTLTATLPHNQDPLYRTPSHRP